MTNASYNHWPLSIVSALTSLINLLLPILLVRMLPQEAVGDYKIFFLYLSLIPAFTFISGLMSNVPFWSGQKQNSVSTLRSSFQLILLAATVGTVLGFLLTPYLQRAFSWSSLEALLFACAIFGTVAHQFIEDCLISRGRIWFSALFGGTFEIVKSLSLIAAAWWWQDTVSVFAAYAGIIGVKVLVAMVIGARNGLLSFELDKASLLQVIKKAAPISTAGLFATFIDRADQFILAQSLSVAEFATYSLGCLIVPPLLSLEGSIMRVSIPHLAKSLSNKDLKAAAREHSYVVEQIALIILPATAGLIVFADPIVSLLFTPQYAAAAGYLKIFALSYLILIIPFDACARAVGASRWMFRSFIFFSILCLVAASGGAFVAGAYGALIATIIAKTLMRLYGLFFTKKTLQCTFAEFLPLSSLTTNAVLVVLLSLVSIALRPIFHSELAWLLVCGSLFGALYLPVALFMRHRAALRMNTHPKVLMLVQTLEIGGLEKHVVDLASSLAKRSDLTVQVLAYDQPQQPNVTLLTTKLLTNNVRVTELSKAPGFSLRTLYQILHVVWTEKVTAVHSHNIGPLLYGSLARILSLGAFKLIHTNHGFTELQQYPRYRLYEKLFTKFCTSIVTVSAEVSEEYRALGVPESSLTLIPNGVNVSAQRIDDREQRFAARKELAQSLNNAALEKHCRQIWILSIARLHPLKGQDKMLELLAKLPREINAEVCLVLVGPESDKEFVASLQKLLRERNLASNALLVGPSEEPQTWYQVADLFISTSLKEGMPLAPLEALSAGIPLALSDIPGHRFLLGHATLLNTNNDSNSASELAELLERLESPNLKEDLVKSRAWVVAQFSHEAMVSRYRALY